MSLEAVIWDFGGVFTTSPFDAFNHYEARHGLPKDFIRRVNASNHLANAWAMLERVTADGAIDVSGDVVATAVQADQLPAQIAVIAPGDYAIAYDGMDGVHLTRVLVP